MSETAHLNAVLDLDDKASPALLNFMANLRKTEAAIRQFGAGLTPKAAQTFGQEAAKAQERANAAIRRGLGLQAHASRQRTDAADSEQRDHIAFETEAVRNLRTRMRLHRQQAREATQAQRAREAAAVAEERQAQRASRAVEAAAVRRQRADAAETRRQEAAARTAERERQRSDARAERDRASEARRVIVGDNWRFALRDRMQRRERIEAERDHRDTVSRGRDVIRHGRDAYQGTTRATGGAAILGLGAAAAGARRVLGAETSTDTAEINTRAYGGLSREAARELRDKWAAPTAEELGVDPAMVLDSWTEATKLGVPNSGAKDFAALAVKTSEAWSVPLDNVKDVLGNVNTLLTAKGAPFDIERLKSTANTLQHLAAKQSTTPEKLISFMKRGAGGADMLGMSMESALAFGSASTSLGNQAGESGSLLDYIAGRIVKMPRLTQKKGAEGDQARDLMRSLGYGSAESMDRSRRADPDAFLGDFMERFSRISDPKRQEQAIQFFAGQEWLGEFGRMVKGAETFKEAQKLAKEAKGLDAIGQVWDLHRLKLQFVGKQFRAGWLNILGEFGKELSPLARQVGDFFLEWTGKLRAGGIKDRFKAVLDGLMEGLGVKDFPTLLRNVFGDPKTATGGSIETWREAARGFGAGIKDVVDTITGAAKLFTGGDMSPEALGKLTAQVLGFGFALLVVAPFVGVLGAIGSALLGLAAAAGLAWKVLAGLGIVGGGTAAAGAGGVGAGAAAGATVGGAAGLLGRVAGGAGLGAAATAGAYRGEISTWILRRVLPEWWQNALGWNEAEKKPATGGSARAWTDPPGKPPASDPAGAKALQDALRTIDPKLAERLFPGGATVQKQSAMSEDWRGLIRPAVATDETDAILRDERGWFDAGRSLGDGFLYRVRRGLGTANGTDADRGTDAVERLTRTITTASYRVGTGSSHGISAATALGGSSATAGASPGISPSDPAQAFGKRFFTPPGMTVPSWHGKGSGLPDPGAGSGPYKAALDYIAQAEGTAGAPGGGYGTSLGYGKFLPGGHEQNLTEMSLRQILALGDYMRRQRGNPNSSALGRYQIVGQTLRDLMRKLGLSGDEKFDAALQDRLGAELIRQRGANAHGLGQEWASLKGGKGLRAAELVGQIPQGAPTAPGPRGPVVGGVHPLDGAGRITSAFGMRRHPISGQHKMHNGIDLAAPAGTVVKAMKAGIASIDGSGDVTVKHDDGTSTTYRHVKAAVEAGARVAEGQAIARLRANDPRSTGPHLHLEARDREGRLHDPRSLLVPSERLVAAAQDVDGGGFKSTGWKKADGPVAGVDPGFTSTGWKRAAEGLPATADRAQGMIRNVPLPPQRPAGLGGGAGAGTVVNNHMTINGAGKNPKELADDVQRHISEAMNNRGHEIEPELA